MHCEEWELGPGASLRCGLGALGEDIDAAVVVLADGPNLAPAAVERVLETWREARRRRGGVLRRRQGPPARHRARRLGRHPGRRASRSTRAVSSRATTWARQATSTRRRISPRSKTGGVEAAKLVELRHEPGRHPLDRARLHVLAQALLEAIAPRAVVAPGEVPLGFLPLHVGERSVQEVLEELLAAIAGVAAHVMPPPQGAASAPGARDGGATSPFRSGRRGSAPHPRR